MKDQTPDDIKLALENLLHTVSKHNGAVVVGYLFCNEPLWITTVSNVQSYEFIETVETIHSIARTKIKQDLVVPQVVRQVS